LDIFKLTEKELMVLNYFIDNESKILLEKNPIDKHFIIYPGKIETELGGKISRVYAKEVCEKFIIMGILSKSETDSPKKDSGKSYYLMNHDLITFKKIVRLILENLERETVVERFGQAYFQSKIDEKLVKKVLFERGVILLRRLEISNWQELEGKQLFNEFPRTISIMRGQSIDDLPDSDIISFDVYMQRKLERLEPEENILNQLKTYNQFYPFWISIDLPVLDESCGRTIEEYIGKIEELNEKLFTSCPSLKKYLSGIEEHYNIWQEKNLISPILILIKISPSALGEFLYGNWTLGEKSYCMNYLTGHFERIMTKLLFLTISDLALTGSYPKNELVNGVHIRPKVTKINGNEEDKLLSCNFDRYLEIYFDTCTSEISSDRKWPFASVIDRGYTYTSDILRKYSDFVENIKNFSEILNYLKNKEKPISRIFYKHLPILSRNLLTYCNPLENIPIALEKILKYDIFEVLTKVDWNELLYTCPEELSDKSIKLLEDLKRLDDIYYRIEKGQNILKDVVKNAFFPELKDDSYCNNINANGGEKVV
jgi:hypothetical protein